MKKSKMLAAAMASIALTGSLGSCAFNACENVEPDVYGPPQPYEDPVEEPESAEEPAPSGEYDPIYNMQPGVYGPPETMEGTKG
ncbi:MAG: hypothetical protein IJM51_01155 [Clostridia bacterium]|nr:hypothetical protein [Clostridia bacterium]